MRFAMYEPRIRRYVCDSELPVDVREALRIHAIEHPEYMFDDSDINFYYHVPLKSNAPCIVELKKLLNEHVIEENMFGILFYK